MCIFYVYNIESYQIVEVIKAENDKEAKHILEKYKIADEPEVLEICDNPAFVHLE